MGSSINTGASDYSQIIQSNTNTTNINSISTETTQGTTYQVNSNNKSNSNYTTGGTINESIEEYDLNTSTANSQITSSSEIDYEKLNELYDYVERTMQYYSGWNEFQNSKGFQTNLQSVGLEGTYFENYSDFVAKIHSCQSIFTSSNLAQSNLDKYNAISKIQNPIYESACEDIDLILNNLTNFNLTADQLLNDDSMEILKQIIETNCSILSANDIKDYAIENNLYEAASITNILNQMYSEYTRTIGTNEANVNYWTKQLEIANNIKEIEQVRLNKDFDSIVETGKETIEPSELMEILTNYRDGIVNEEYYKDSEGEEPYLPDEAIDLIISEHNLISIISENFSAYTDSLSTNALLSTNAFTNVPYSTEISEYYKKVEVMTIDEINTYTYLYQKEGVSAAENYLDSLNETLNQRRGALSAQNFVENLDNESAAIAWLTSFKKGIYAGVGNNLRGIQNTFLADGTMTAEEYEQQYILEFLQEKYPSAVKIFFEAGVAEGNMLPAVLLGLTASGGGVSKSIASLLQSANLFASSYGNTYNQTLMQGYDETTSKEYAMSVALIETVGDMVLGTLPGIATGYANLSDALGVDSDALKKLIDILQEVGSENIQNLLEGAMQENFLNQEYEITSGEILDTTLVSIIMSLTMGGAEQTYTFILDSFFQVSLTSDQIMNLIKSDNYTSDGLMSLLLSQVESQNNNIGEETNLDMLASNLANNLDIEKEVAEIMLKNNCSEEIAEIMQKNNCSKEIAEIMLKYNCSKEVSEFMTNIISNFSSKGISEEILEKYLSKVVTSEEEYAQPKIEKAINFVQTIMNEEGEDFLTAFNKESVPNGATQILAEYLKKAYNFDTFSDEQKVSIIKEEVKDVEKITEEIIKAESKKELESAELTINKIIERYNNGYYEVSIEEVLEAKVSGKSEFKKIIDPYSGEDYTTYFPVADSFISDKCMIEYVESFMDSATMEDYTNYLKKNNLSGENIINLGKYLKSRTDAGNPVTIKTITIQDASATANNYKKGSVGRPGSAIEAGYFGINVMDLETLSQAYPDIFYYNEITGELKIYDIVKFGQEILGAVQLSAANGVYEIVSEIPLASCSMPSVMNAGSFLANMVPGGLLALEVEVHEIVKPSIEIKDDKPPEGVNVQISTLYEAESP